MYSRPPRAMTPLRFSQLPTLAMLVVAVHTATVRPAAAQAASSPPPLTGLAGAIAKARADSARLPYVKADIEFMSTMIHHHAQAIVMAKWAPTHGANPEVQRLCERIVNAQTDEIALMSRWLEARSQRVPVPNPAGMTMQMGGMEHTMLMPGMLTEDQMRELDAARGAAFDRLLLTGMIQHHRGAVSMVKELFTAYGAAQDETVFKFANDVEVDQTTEITRMFQMLLTIGAP